MTSSAANSRKISKDEEILLKVDEVKSRKGGDGTLYVLSKRILWLSSDATPAENLHISTHYTEINVQKISPEGKSKIQLQLCLHNGENYTFHFASSQGPSKQLQDREKVKELLQQRLAQSKLKLNADLEIKQKILQENRELFSLYKELVTTNVISADEFWQTYASEELKSKSQTGQQNEQQQQQKVGISSGFLSDVTKADGCNGIKLNLTTDIIESIFRTYPSVKKKHEELVPEELSEKDFWTKFFQSQYFHRDRTKHPQNSVASQQEFFAECLKIDNEDFQAQLNNFKKNKRTIQEVDEDLGVATGFDLDDDNRAKNRNPANAELIRKFNYRSGRVLRDCLGDDQASSSTAGSATMATLGSLLPTTSKHTDSPEKKRRISLDSEELLMNNDSEMQTIALNLAHTEKYHQISGGYSGSGTGSTGSSDNAAAPSTGRFSEQDVIRWTSTLSKAVENLRNNPLSSVDLKEVVDSSAAYAVLLDLSSSSSSNYCQLNDLLSPNVFEEIRSMYLALSKLLRHFWSCFPTTSPELETKLTKSHDTLKKFDESRLKQWTERLNGHNSFGATNLVSHLRTMLQTAYSKFDNWSQRK